MYNAPSTHLVLKQLVISSNLYYFHTHYTWIYTSFYCMINLSVLYLFIQYSIISKFCDGRYVC